MSNPFKLTVFTPTYNRVHTLPRLYESLLRQSDSQSFEWLVIDDCSTDGTQDIVSDWIADGEIDINYIRLPQNGGKPRAINLAVEKARSPYLFIVDSDDYLTDNIIDKIIKAEAQVDNIEEINGIGVLQVHQDGTCFAAPNFKDYVDATNLERNEHGLAVDCNEAYKISVLRKYPFKVWDGENFVPEETVLNAMALDGYKIRWLNINGIVADYQNDGLTKGSWNLQKKNPMGYAMLYDSKLLYLNDARERVSAIIQMTAQSFLGKNSKYIFRSNAPVLATLLLPVSLIVYLRRLWQYRSV